LRLQIGVLRLQIDLLEIKICLLLTTRGHGIAPLEELLPRAENLPGAEHPGAEHPVAMRARTALAGLLLARLEARQPGGRSGAWMLFARQNASEVARAIDLLQRNLDIPAGDSREVKFERLFTLENLAWLEASSQEPGQQQWLRQLVQNEPSQDEPEVATHWLETAARGYWHERR
jgi:hypothetical protein